MPLNDLEMNLIKVDLRFLFIWKYIIVLVLLGAILTPQYKTLEKEILFREKV